MNSMLAKIECYDRTNSTPKTYTSEGTNIIDFEKTIDKIKFNYFIKGMLYERSHILSDKLITSSSETIFEVMKMKDEIKNLSDKLDKNFDKIDEKLDNIKDVVHGIDIRLVSVEEKVNIFSKNIEEIKTDIKEKNNFWKQYVIAPLSTSIFTGIIVTVVLYFFGLR